MSESFQSRLLRWSVPWLYPAVGRTGLRVTYISADYLTVKIKLPLNWKTRNIVGAIFGGAMYAAADPFFMSILIKQLGRGYAVWDKSARIRFLKPGRSTLYATFHVPADEVARVKHESDTAGKTERTYTVVWLDAEGQAHAEVEKVVSIKKLDRKGAPVAGSSVAQAAEAATAKASATTVDMADAAVSSGKPVLLTRSRS